MRIIYRYNIFAVVLLVFTLLTACERTELCYNHYPVASVSFEWEREWERDYGKSHQTNWDADYHGFVYDYLRPGRPEWISLVKYKDNIPAGEHFFYPGGGDVILKEEGKHSFLFYNGDTEYIVFSDIASLPNARASATPRSRASMAYMVERHPDARSANPPDILYAAFFEEVPDIQVHQVKPLNVKMQPLVYTYIVRYEFEYGLEHVAIARGALGGMAESVYLRDGRTSDESIIILYDCDKKDYGCMAQVRSFGIPGFPDEYYGRSASQRAERPYTLNLEVLLTNGKTMEFNFDVSDQLRNQPRGGVITVSGIRIEDEQNKPSGSSGAFDVDLSGWGQVDIDLPVNSNK